MGFSSSLCAKTKVSIPANLGESIPRKHSAVVALFSDGSIFKGDYDGYQRLMMDDALVINIMDKLKEIGAFKDDGNFMDEFYANVKLVLQSAYTGEKFDDLPPSENCPYQGFFYPDFALHYFQGLIELEGYEANYALDMKLNH